MARAVPWLQLRVPILSQFVWPADTNLVFSSGTNKLSLTSQRPLIRVVIHEGMEIVQADLLTRHAFPDPTVVLVGIKDALLTSGSRYPGATSIYRRLLFDEEYMTAIIPLVSSQCLAAMVLTQFKGARSDAAFPKRDRKSVV